METLFRLPRRAPTSAADVTPETILLRQVHPNFVQEGQLSSQAFFPFPKDKGRLSVYDGDRITAAESHDHYTEVLGNASDSVWGVSLEEIADEALSAIADPLNDFPSHVLIDFAAHPERSFRKVAKRLKAYALARGCLYRPE